MASPQPPFYIGKATRFHIGTIAVFQVDETDILETLPTKIAGLSDNPLRIAYSRMGENVATEPRSGSVIPRKLTRSTFKLSYRERQRLENIFLICYIETGGLDQQPRFAFVNVRGDRIESLLEALEKPEQFNLSEKSTIILAGADDVEEVLAPNGHVLITRNSRPTDGQIQRLRSDYLFGDDSIGFTNVRIFPPLQDVTEKPTEWKFEFGAFSGFHIGCISTFGIDDENLIRSVVSKIVSLNDNLGPLVYSKYGEPVPQPPYAPSNLVHRTYDDIEWEYEEVAVFDKVFVIAYFSSTNSKNERVFAFVNCRADRLRGLLYKGQSTEYYDLASYATIVLSGYGIPNDEEREKLETGYLFGEGHVNIRISPHSRR